MLFLAGCLPSTGAERVLDNFVTLELPAGAWAVGSTEVISEFEPTEVCVVVETELTQGEADALWCVSDVDFKVGVVTFGSVCATKQFDLIPYACK